MKIPAGFVELQCTGGPADGTVLLLAGEAEAAYLSDHASTVGCLVYRREGNRLVYRGYRGRAGGTDVSHVEENA